MIVLYISTELSFKEPESRSWRGQVLSSTAPGNRIRLCGTKDLVPSIWYHMFGTTNGTKYLVPNIEYLVPRIWYQVFGTKYLVPSTKDANSSLFVRVWGGWLFGGGCIFVGGMRAACL